MKVVQINATCGIGSTGKICVDISRALTDRGVENYILFSTQTSGYELGIACSSKKYIQFQAGKSRMLGNYGFNSRAATKRMIAELERIQPDIVHLHNIHGHDCDLEMLFRYFKKKKQRLIWTFHDCWAFTAYCPHFTMIGCDRWKQGCSKCPQLHEYSFLFDNSASIYQKKKELFSNLDLTIVTPSKWLAKLVKESFLWNYPVIVINNGIDLGLFKPTESSFREKHNISPNQKIILGVSFDWGIRKGLDIFIELAKVLDPLQYQIVMVGTNDSIDKKLPSEIVSIHRTYNQEELAGIYTTSDLLVNPTREDNYPTVNIESIACGTPVLTFNTGGSPEILDDKTGKVLDSEDMNLLKEAIQYMCADSNYARSDCVSKAKQFDKNEKYQDYIRLYMQI